jgi:apolipoprotein D and lipocalin family protein
MRQFFASTLLAGGVALATLTGCQSLPENPPQTVESVDLQRYAGLWYEIARLPMPFQKDNERATAEYTLNSEGTVGLVNTAIAQNGETRSVTGTAVPVATSSNAKLKVTIDVFFAKLFGSPPDFGNYWVLKLEDDYSLALVGSPSRKSLWLLSRTPEIDPGLLESYLQHARDQGYETEELIVNNGAP